MHTITVRTQLALVLALLVFAVFGATSSALACASAPARVPTR